MGYHFDLTRQHPFRRSLGFLDVENDKDLRRRVKRWAKKNNAQVLETKVTLMVDEGGQE